jgi:hypothetical protein
VQRFCTERWTIENEMARQLCGEVLRIRCAATVPAHEYPPASAVPGDQVLANSARGG